MNLAFVFPGLEFWKTAAKKFLAVPLPRYFEASQQREASNSKKRKRYRVHVFYNDFNGTDIFW
jgi:hypothetical protein